MNEKMTNDYINKNELIYWIDKAFVQDTAQTKIGRDLTQDELVKFTKMIEWGLWDSVFDTINIAISEATSSEN